MKMVKTENGSKIQKIYQIWWNLTKKIFFKLIKKVQNVTNRWRKFIKNYEKNTDKWVKTDRKSWKFIEYWVKIPQKFGKSTKIDQKLRTV